ncbi:MAG: PAS domain S-box protein [Humidesulfovibrio sp.]|nr:PAS domain S-box protein [Humidesulfovibrio sp.]
MPQNKPPSLNGAVRPAKAMPPWKAWLPSLLILCAAASLALASFLGHQSEPLALLFLGVVLAVAVFLIVRNLDATRARTEALAAVMTSELHQSEAYNRAVFQHSSLPIAVCGPDDRFLDVNPALLDLFCYSREEFLGLCWQDIIHPDHWEDNVRLMREALAGEREEYRLELCAWGKPRQPIWMLLSVGLARAEDGQVQFFIGALKDISERRKMEVTQAESQALYRAMFESNRAMCLLVDPADGRIVDANRAAAEFYGYSRLELQTMCVGKLNTLPPEEVAAALAEAGERGGMFDYLHRLRDGSLRNMRVHTGLFDAGGEPLLLSTLQDVTDQVRAEAALSESRERFRNLVESTDQGVVLNDENERITYVNPAFAQMMGHAPEVLSGQPVGSVLTEEEALLRPDRMAARRRGSREPYETRLTRVDGSELMVRVMPFPLLDAKGGFQGSGGLVVDITAQHTGREIERQRQARHAALLKLHEMQHAPRQELLDFALEQTLAMTGSTLGYIYAYDDDACLFSLHAWSAGVSGLCGVREPQEVYHLDQTGVWGDAVRLREPVLLNDFSAPHPGKRGQPEGHVPLSRFLTVPVIRMGRVRAVVGVANKKIPYTEEDITQLKLFADGVWGILERQAAEQELREVTERFQRAVRAGRVGLWEWDIRTGMAHCDTVMEELFGLDGEDRTRTPEDWLRRVHAEDREAVLQALVGAAAQGTRFAASFRVPRPDGGTTHIEASAAAQLSPTGEPLRLVGVNIDVTRLREAEQKLAQSEERFRHLFENAPIPYQSLNAQGALLLVNAAWLDVLGYTAGEVLGRDFAELLHPDCLPRFHEHFARFKEEGVANGIEYRLLGKDGRTHLVSINGRVARDAQGRFLSTHCTFFDITDRRAEEEKLAQQHRFLQTLVDNLPIPFVCKDAQGRYLMVNNTFADLYSVSKADILGRTLLEFGPEDAAQLHCARDQELLSRQDDSDMQYEVDFSPPGQEPRHWLVFKSRLRLPEGGFGLVSITLDITERKQAEEALREERRRLTDVIEGTNTGTWEWNIVTGEVICNERWARIIGLEPQEASPLTREFWSGRTHPDDAPRIKVAMERHSSGESQYFDAEYRLRHTAGHWVWVHSRGRVFHAASDGSPLLMSGTLTDISQRKLAEERLALVARFPVENPNPVLRADAKGVLLYANPAAEPLLESWAQKVGGRLPRELRRELHLALESGQVRTTERSYACGVYSVTVSPFVDKGYVNVYAVNETQRKAAEMALRLSELRYRELAVLLRLMCDNVPDMIWAKDMENRYLFANKAMCEQFLGLDDPNLPLGKTEQYFAEREQAVHPDDPNWHTVWEACIRSDAETLQGVGRGQYEESGYFKGQFRHYDVRKAPFVNDQGIVIGTVGTARDITTRKGDEEALTRSEERFRTLAQVSPVGIFQADAKGRCTYVNDQWSRISGYPKATAIGRGWLRTLDFTDRRGILQGLRETARTGDDFVTEFRFRVRTGQGRWVLVRAATERDQQGRFIGFVGAVTDISELKRAEVALRQAKAEAEAATEAKALFLANMSHEIRTPLAGVIGTTRLLAQSRLDETQRQLAEMAADSGRALLDVVNDILDFSKIEAGRLTLRSAPFALRRMVHSIIGPLELLARERSLFLRVDVADNAPDVLVGDEARLGQVLRNLLTNALKFTETGGITFVVRLEKRTEDEARFVFSVTDTGIGIDPGYLPHLFDSFSQADSSYGKQHGGTGLGLAISNSLVEQMGGLIQVRSSLGKGSTFTATVPFGLDVRTAAPSTPAPENPVPEAEPQREPAPPAGAGGLRVLLADDNAIGRVLMEHVLTATGYEVSCVADGQEVLRALRAGRFDLVLMDVQMPRMDGLAATRQIRLGAAGQENKGIAVVALTAYTSREDRRNCFDAGMDDAVSKPAEDESLFAAMERALAAAKVRAQTGGVSGAGPAPSPPARLDEEYLERSFGGNPSLLAHLLRQFLDKSLPEIERDLDRAQARKDLNLGYATVHRARGTLAVIGAVQGAELAASAEASAARNDWSRFVERLQAVQTELDALAEHLRQGLPWGPAKGYLA